MHQHWASLKEKARLPDFPWTLGNFSAKVREELASRRAVHAWSLLQWVQLSIGRQCWNICPPCGQRQALPLNLLLGAPATYESANGQVIVTSQHSALSLCHGTSVRPSGCFPSVRNSPVGSLLTRKPAEAKPRAIMSFRAWCLAVLPEGRTARHHALNICQLSTLFNSPKQIQEYKSQLSVRNVGWTERQRRCTNSNCPSRINKLSSNSSNSEFM